jgi:hypothetical protein
LFLILKFLLYREITENAGKYFKEKLLSSMESRSIVRMKKCVSIEYSQFDEVGAILGGACYVLDDFFHNNYEY